MAKHIYIYSPSGAVRDKAAFNRGIRFLKKQGHEVEVDPAALTSHQRFAGDDATRVAAIHRAAACGADVALISRGGYGLTRILQDINFKLVAKAIAKGTHFVGMSDFTALQLALLQTTGGISWAGPALCEGFGAALGVATTGKDTEGHAEAAAGGPDDIMLACFDDLLLGQGEGCGWRQSKGTAQAGGQAGMQYDLELHNAPLWGGNLSVLCSLVGSPWLPPIQGGVLFVEDVAEHPYRVERLLTQLLNAGILAQQKAIVLGQFNHYQLTPHDRGFKLQSVVDWLRTRVKTPVLTNLPFGHVPTKVLLPVGAKVDMVVQGRDVMVAWGHLQVVH